MNDSHSVIKKYLTLQLEVSLDGRVFLVSHIHKVWMKKQKLKLYFLISLFLLLIGAMIAYLKIINPDDLKNIQKFINDDIPLGLTTLIFISVSSLLLISNLLVVFKTIKFFKKLKRRNYFYLFSLEQQTCSYNFPLLNGGIRGIQIDPTTLSPLCWESVGDDVKQVNVHNWKPLFGQINDKSNKDKTYHVRVFFNFANDNGYLHRSANLPDWGKGRLPIFESHLSDDQIKEIDDFVLATNKEINKAANLISSVA